MSYDYNTVRWPIGSYVIHSADAKEPHMLMVVIGYSKTDLCKTRYAFPAVGAPKREKNRVWLNDIQWLLNPKDFGIDVDEYLKERAEVLKFFAKLDVMGKSR